jgi:hypothetical protein
MEIKKRRPNNWQLRNACICVRALAKLMSTPWRGYLVLPPLKKFVSSFEHLLA